MKKLSLLLMSLIAMVIFAGCGDSPKDVAIKWGNAIADGDVKTANKYSTEQTQSLNVLIAAGLSADKDSKDVQEFKDNIKKLKSAKEEINGDTAKVIVEGDSDGIPLKKVDGQWKVDVQK